MSSFTKAIRAWHNRWFNAKYVPDWPADRSEPDGRLSEPSVPLDRPPIVEEAPIYTDLAARYRNAQTVINDLNARVAAAEGKLADAVACYEVARKCLYTLTRAAQEYVNARAVNLPANRAQHAWAGLQTALSASSLQVQGMVLVTDRELKDLLMFFEEGIQQQQRSGYSCEAQLIYLKQLREKYQEAINLSEGKSWVTSTN